MPQQTTTYACAACYKCTSLKLKNSSVDDTGFTKSAKWHDCDRAALLLWHMFIAKNAPMLWWYATSKREHHMLESSSEEKPSLAADPAEDAARALAVESSLNKSCASSIKTLSSAATTTRELGRNARHGP